MGSPCRVLRPRPCARLSSSARRPCGNVVSDRRPLTCGKPRARRGSFPAADFLVKSSGESCLAGAPKTVPMGSPADSRWARRTLGVMPNRWPSSKPCALQHATLVGHEWGCQPGLSHNGLNSLRSFRRRPGTCFASPLMALPSPAPERPLPATVEAIDVQARVQASRLRSVDALLVDRPRSVLRRPRAVLILSPLG